MNICQEQFNDAIKVDCLVVGAGISGVCFAYYAKQKGLDYRIVEANPSFGGTWYHNKYPNLTTDSPAPMFSFSFKRPDFKNNKETLSLYKNPAEVEEYLSTIINDNQLDNGLISYNTKVISAQFIDNGYLVQTTKGKYYAKFLILGVGILGHPQIPDFKDSEYYKGELIHSSQLKSDFCAKDKNICIIGNGATSLQLVESFAKNAKHLTILCRTPRKFYRKLDMKGLDQILITNNIDPQNTELRKDFLERLYANYILTGFGEGEKNNIAFGHLLSGEGSMYQQFFPPTQEERDFIELMKKKGLIPPADEGINTLRVMLYTTYPQDVLRPNVEILNTRVECLEEDGLITTEGQKIKADVIIAATGYAGNVKWPFFDIDNGEGVKMSNNIEVLLQNYYGIMNNNFPNLFIMYGLGCPINNSDSITGIIEPQVELITTLIAESKKEGDFKTIKLNKDKFIEFHKRDHIERKRVQNLIAKAGDKKITNHYLYQNGYPITDFMFGNFIDYRDIMNSLRKDIFTSNSFVEVSY